MSANDSIRPFQIDIPEESLQELRRRVATPGWPDRETVSDRTPGAQLAKYRSSTRCRGADRLVMIEEYTSAEAREEHRKGVALAGPRSAVEGKRGRDWAKMAVPVDRGGGHGR